MSTTGRLPRPGSLSQCKVVNPEADPAQPTVSWMARATAALGLAVAWGTNTRAIFSLYRRIRVLELAQRRASRADFSL